MAFGNSEYFDRRREISQVIFFLFLFFFCLICPKPTFAAWSGQYWNVTPSAGPSFPARAADYVRNDENIDFDWDDGSPALDIINIDGFVARWTQTLNFAAGTYYFQTRSDDGARIYIDGALILNSWIDQGATYHSTVANITAGSHEIKVEYYENGGGAVMQLFYENESPVVRSYSPADNANGASLNGNLVLTFDKNVYVSSGSANDIVIYNADDQAVEQINATDTNKVSISGSVATINPTTALSDFTNYYVKIKSNIFYSSSYGIAYSGISDKTTWNFQTGDFTKPNTSDDYGGKDGVWQDSSQIITLTPSDPAPGSGISWTRYCTDDGISACNPTAGTVLSSPHQITINNEGITYLRYASQDSSGNTQNTVSRVIKIDKTAPTVSAGGNQTVDVSFVQTASVSDSMSGMNASTYRWSKISGSGDIVFGNAGSLSTSINTDKPGTYVIGFTAEDNAGNLGSGSFTFIKNAAIGLPAQAFADPAPPAEGFGVKINDGETVTANRKVLLKFNAGSDVKKMAISTSDDFSDTGLENFQPVKSWDLCAGNSGLAGNFCAEGKYTIYVKFYTAWGRSSDPVLASVNFMQTGVAVSDNQTAIPVEINSRAIEESKGTKEQTITNQSGSAGSTAKFVFTRGLRLGMSGEDVRQLQMFLNRTGFSVADSGPGSLGQETAYFGRATRQAVIKFQEKYNLKPCPGNVGPATLRLLNSFM